MKKNPALSIICLSIFVSLSSKSKTTTTEKDSVARRIENNQTNIGVAQGWKKVSLDLSLGTSGIGLNAIYFLSKKWSIRFGVSYLPINYNTPVLLSGYTTHIDLENNFTGLNLMAEWRPINKSKIKFIGGIAFYPIATLDCDIKPFGIYEYGSLNLNPEDIGVIDITIDWKGISPYIGIGYENLHPKRRISINYELGMYYLSCPSVSITGTKFLCSNDQNQQYLGSIFKDYRYFPVLKIGLSYRFKIKHIPLQVKKVNK